MWALENKTPYGADRNWTRDSDGVHWWVVAVRATFDLCANGKLRLADEQPPPVLAPEYFGDPGASSLRYESDLLYRKPTTDIVLNASAYSPNARAVPSVPVEFRVGGIHKRLIVHGERIYYEGARSLLATKPKPFVRQPIRYECAFGGVDTFDEDPSRHRMVEENPIGRGFTRKPKRLVHELAHQIEYADRRRGPAGFGALDPAWMPRRGFAGTYDKKWEERKKPLLPDDFDLRFGMGAPLDQQPAEPLKGGEAVLLSNLTEEGTTIFEVPELTLEMESRFGRRRQVHDEVILSGLMIEPDEKMVSVVWQSCIRVAAPDADYLDVTEIRERQGGG